MREHLERGHLAATEQLLGLLAALTLRNPSAGPLALESGCLTCALQVCLALCIHGGIALCARRTGSRKTADWTSVMCRDVLSSQGML